MIVTLPHLLAPDALQQAGALLRQAPWQDGAHSAGEQARAVKHNQQLPHDCEPARQIRALVLQALEQHPQFLSAALPLRVFTPRINRYSAPSQHYGLHVDNAIRLRTDGQRVRTDLSCTVFLNAPEDYEGGELCIQDTLGEQTIKLPAGHAVLYPGTTLHQVRPVTRGQRLACFFWVQSLVRRDEQRRLLHELDMNLLALRQRHGESAETTALTGTYHNLLRLWAET